MKLFNQKFSKKCTLFVHLAGEISIPISTMGTMSKGYKSQNPCNSKGFGYCAREETRTPTAVTPQASETCASTNFATRAEVEMLRITLQRKRMV